MYAVKIGASFYKVHYEHNYKIEMWRTLCLFQMHWYAKKWQNWMMFD